jgi:chromosome segregation ATPase
MTTTDQPMDFRDYMVREQQRDHMRQQLEAITPSQEDRDHDAATAVERHAIEVGQECHNVVSAAEDDLLSTSSRARDLRSEILSGTVSRDEALKRLQDLHKQRDALLAKIRSTKSVYDSAAKSVEDPTAAVTSLRQRFPSLNG